MMSYIEQAALLGVAMGATRIGRLEAADRRLGRTSRSQIHDIFRIGTAPLAAAPWLWALGALCLVGIGVEQAHALAFHAPTLRAVIETEITLCALAAACLFGLSFEHRRHLREMLLVVALLALATIDLASYVLPAALSLNSPGLLTTAPMLEKLFTAVVLVVAAWAGPDRRVPPGRRPLVLAIGGSLIAAGLAEAGGWALRGHFAVTHDVSQSGVGAALHHPLGVLLSITATVLMVAATARIARTEGASDDSVSRLLAAAMIVFAAVRLNYVVLPTPGIGWVTAREGMRLVGYGLFLAAALRQEWAIRRTIATAAAAEERRRIARDLHDGLAQDLAFIAAHGDRLAREAGEDHPLAIAARRALAVSRGAIADLSASEAPSARAALRQVAAELEVRFGVRVSVEAEDVELSGNAREDVVRIVREAIVNAVHGQARNVVVSLARTGKRFVLRVLDDGAGIAAGELKARPGHGLRAMQERATALGGGLTARPGARGGTELVVRFP
jgi:signal transduction histidine kinase